MQTLFENVRSDAVFSPCQRFRYTLMREWSDGPKLMFEMCNPSKATAEISDPTVTRCIGHAKRLGFGGLWVGNIFALRSTDPDLLYEVEDPIGPENE